MKHALTRPIRLFVVALAFGAAPSVSFAQKQAVDLGSFIKEAMSIKMESDHMQMAMWLPFEFFVEANAADGTTSRAQIESNMAFLKPFHTVVVQRSFDRPDGTSQYAPQAEVRAAAVLRLADGTEIKPLDRIPPLVSATVEAMKAMIAAEGDEGSANLHVLVFPAKADDGSLIIDTGKKDKMTLVLKADQRFKEAVIVWRTPFDAVSAAPPCLHCRETVSAKWTFCPWCGKKLEAP